ncbi:MAG: ribosome biogenesis factor YjgA [Gammaproteobacteria bacterium]|jgi:ribosome-associated protein|nr:DUF615 domain-containing protein [Gammaproteobacteria bacterium]
MSRQGRYLPEDELEPTEEERPSKSARKRAAHAAQALGERLISLKESDLLRLPLPETLLEAVRAARRIKARGGLARQKQYIGKLMRDLDTAQIEEALDNLR